MRKITVKGRASIFKGLGFIWISILMCGIAISIVKDESAGLGSYFGGTALFVGGILVLFLLKDAFNPTPFEISSDGNILTCSRNGIAFSNVDMSEVMRMYIRIETQNLITTSIEIVCRWYGGNEHVLVDLYALANLDRQGANEILSLIQEQFPDVEYGYLPAA